MVIGILDVCHDELYVCASLIQLQLFYMSPKMPANVFRRFFMVSSASSVRAALREPCRAKPPRPAAEPAAGAAPGAELLATLGAADADDTVDDWEAVETPYMSDMVS